MPPRKKNYQQFAVLFVNGPAGVKGDWAAAERVSGVTADPLDPAVRDAVIKEGGSMPYSTLPEVPSSISSLDLLTGAMPQTDDEWKQLARKLQGTIEGIANGTIKASASQAAVLRHILDRAYGRVTAEQSEKQMPIGVVILPTLGERANMTMCPQCGYTPKVAEPTKSPNE